MNRLLGGMLAAIAILLLAVAPVAAGGWASITPDESTPEPVAGGTVDLGFTVLQHGMTPASWVTATVVATNAQTGETVRAAAKATDESGHFVATLTVEDAGVWTWQVELVELETSSTPTALTVRAADGSVPVLDGADVVAIVEQAKAQIRAELRGEYQWRLDDLERLATTGRADRLALETRLDVAADAREGLAARVDALEAAPGAAPISPLALVAVVTVAVLASGVTAFVLVALSRPPAPREIAVAQPDRVEVATSR